MARIYASEGNEVTKFLKLFLTLRTIVFWVYHHVKTECWQKVGTSFINRLHWSSLVFERVIA